MLEAEKLKHHQSIKLVDKLKNITKAIIDKTVSTSWATQYGLNQALREWMGEGVYLIHTNHLIDSLLSDNRLECYVNYIKILRNILKVIRQVMVLQM